MSTLFQATGKELRYRFNTNITYVSSLNAPYSVYNGVISSAGYSTTPCNVFLDDGGFSYSSYYDPGNQWYYTSSTSLAISTPVSQKIATSTDLTLEFYTNTNGYDFFNLFEGYSSRVKYNGVNYTPPVAATGIFHVAVCIKGEETYIYHNGLKIATVPGGNPFKDITNQLISISGAVSGTRVIYPKASATKRFYDFRISDRALYTQDDESANIPAQGAFDDILFNELNGFSNKETLLKLSPFAFYDLNEPSGSTVMKNAIGQYGNELIFKGNKYVLNQTKPFAIDTGISFTNDDLNNVTSLYTNKFNVDNNLKGSSSISVWIKKQSAVGPFGETFVSIGEEGTNKNFSVGLTPTGNLAISKENGYTGSAAKDVGVNLRDGAWHNVIISSNGKSYTDIFVDGVYIISFGSYFFTFSANTKVLVGGNVYNQSGYNGFIDNVTFYDFFINDKIASKIYASKDSANLAKATFTVPNEITSVGPVSIPIVFSSNVTDLSLNDFDTPVYGSFTEITGSGKNYTLTYNAEQDTIGFFDIVIRQDSLKGLGYNYYNNVRINTYNKLEKYKGCVFDDKPYFYSSLDLQKYPTLIGNTVWDFSENKNHLSTTDIGGSSISDGGVEGNRLYISSSTPKFDIYISDNFHEDNNNIKLSAEVWILSELTTLPLNYQKILQYSTLNVQIYSNNIYLNNGTIPVASEMLPYETRRSRWYQVVMVVSQTEAILYFDGAEILRANISNVIFDKTNTLFSFSPNGGKYIDETSLYNRILTPEEIDEHFQLCGLKPAILEFDPPKDKLLATDIGIQTMKCTFIEPVDLFTNDDIYELNGKITIFNFQKIGDGTQWYVKFSPNLSNTEPGEYTFKVDHIERHKSPELTIPYDFKAPETTLTAIGGAVNVDNPTKIISLTFSDAVVDFDQNLINISNGGEITSVTALRTGLEYELTYTAADNIEELVTISIDAGTFHDNTGNSCTGDSVQFFVDTRVPGAVTIVIDPAILLAYEDSPTDIANITVTFAEAPLGFTNDDIRIELNGSLIDPSIGTLTGSLSGLVWSGTFTPADNITRIDYDFIVGTGWTDINGNPPASETSASFIIDTVIKPKLVNLELSGLSPNNYSLCDTTHVVTITFNVPIITINNIEVKGGKLENLTSTGDGTVWTADFIQNVNINNSDGIIKLNPGSAIDEYNYEIENSKEVKFEVHTVRPKATGSKTIK